MPRRIRTFDPQIRNLMLYPAELWAHFVKPVSPELSRIEHALYLFFAHLAQIAELWVQVMNFLKIRSKGLVCPIRNF